MRIIQRAKIILWTAAGMEGRQIAQQLGTSRPTVRLWRERFLALRTAGLEKDAPRPGRIRPLGNAKRAAIVEATLHSRPLSGFQIAMSCAACANLQAGRQLSGTLSSGTQELLQVSTIGMSN